MLLKKEILLFALAMMCNAQAYGITDIQQQEADRSNMLLEQQIKQIQDQIEMLRELLQSREFEDIISPGSVEGGMIGGEMPQGADPDQLPAPTSDGAQLVNRYCTQCHGLPVPGLHSAAGWPPVVKRMAMRIDWINKNNSRMNISAPTAEELKQISEYMQKFARVFPKR